MAELKGKRPSKKSKADANDSDFDPDAKVETAAAQRKEIKKLAKRIRTLILRRQYDERKDIFLVQQFKRCDGS
jgi:hypothetical protein